MLKKLKQMVNTAIILSVIISFSSCLTNRYTSIVFEPKTDGQRLERPVNKELLKRSILNSLMSYNWLVEEVAEDQIISTYEKSGGIYAEIQIRFNDNGYSIEYRESNNLDYNEERSLIHKNYVRWIRNLNITIYKNYLNSAL